MRRWGPCLLWSLLILRFASAKNYTIEDTDPNIRWNPPTPCQQQCPDGWWAKSDPSYSGSSVRIAAKANLTASFAFKGSAVYWYTTTYPGAGSVSIKVDSDAPTRVDLATSDVRYRWSIFSRTGLTENNQHTINITTLSKNVDIDFFVVMAPDGQQPIISIGTVDQPSTPAQNSTHPGIIAAISIGSTFGVVALGAFFVLLALLIHQHRLLRAENPSLSMGSSSGRRPQLNAGTASSSDMRARWHAGAAAVDADFAYSGHGATSHPGGSGSRRYGNTTGSSAALGQPQLRSDDLARIAEIVAHHTSNRHPSPSPTPIPQAPFLRSEDLARITELVAQHSAVASSTSLPARHPLAQSYPPVQTTHHRPPRSNRPPGDLRGGALAPPRTGGAWAGGGYSSSDISSRSGGVTRIAPEDLEQIADMVAQRLREMPGPPHERRR